MDGLLKKVADFCLQYDMLPRGGTVLACVSGGADSMCLLHALRALAPTMGFDLQAAHFNHELRGAESDGDQAFVREQCEKLSVPLHTGSGDVAGEARRRGAGLEETGRDMRYRFFRELSAHLGGATIATAHTADDNLETVLMRLLRGTGLRGLTGIPPVNGDVVRPMLSVSRAEVEAYLGENRIPHREDSSNGSDEFTRNRLRHRVVPELRAIAPGLDVTGTTELLRRDEEFLNGLAEDFLSKNRQGDALPAVKLAALPFPVASRVIRRFCGTQLGAEHVEAALKLAASPDPSGRLDLPGCTLRRRYGELLLGETPAEILPTWEVPLDSPAIMEGAGYRITCGPGPAGTEIYNSLTTFCLKRDKITDKLLIRSRRSGDALRLPGGQRSLKKLFIDARVPRERREAIPVVEVDGFVAGVYGFGQDRALLPKAGEPAVLIKIEKTEEEEKGQC